MAAKSTKVLVSPSMVLERAATGATRSGTLIPPAVTSCTNR
jgi:hypothetical protein